MEESSGEEYTAPGPSSRAPKRARPSASTSQSHVGHGRGRGRGRGRRRPGPLELGIDDLTRVANLRQQRLDYEHEHISSLSLDQSQEILMRVLDRDPAVIFDILSHSAPSGTSATLTENQPTWCRCSRCREMPTDLEKKCCQQAPENCISISPYVEVYIIEKGVLRLARRLWNEFRAIQDEPDVGEDHRQFRHAAYRQYVAWRHGSLGAGRRVVIPSCVVWRIRDTFPDQTNTYTGFLPTRL